MLKNIKSQYLIKMIFTYLTEKQKLKIIKHNLNFQKIIEININNYRCFTGKYIIYKPNGIAKEYFGYSDILVFEGEYLNGERNGKGKEYSFLTSQVLFEGEYLNGKRNGKGKEYDEYYAKIKYDCEYLNGKKNGKGKEYGDGEKLIFEGEYLDDKELMGKKYSKYGKFLGEFDHTKGIGKEYNLDGYLIYEGEYLNGKRNGKGKEYFFFYNEVAFEGEYLNDLKWNGKGYDKSKNLIYELKEGKGYIKE